MESTVLSRELRRLVRIVALAALAFGAVVLGLSQIVSTGSTGEPSPLAAPPDPSRLTQDTWHWQRTERGDGTIVVSANPSKFTITFGTDGRFDLDTDCNGAAGRYTVSGTQLTFEKAPMTAMGCPQLPQPSQEWVFYDQVLDTLTYNFEGDQLILYLQEDGSHLVLTPRPA
jgi:heat shock protein HslJ